ncbi:diguanylate cyclase (GGDEF) domain protein [Leptospira yanagawae serovar Saopaulo str. Sao Paulo = ATCC 700523]|uniref:Diguanylate cyclase (GGDEF) domain protein n=1 Tax=Leptospira yanagawae serovar Saopaulo str. Sao Paulo = ATCC 700523 TaxID=1249483 RepID=A0A5E8HBK8_9LEPT|nr:GGDEF domain-containing phosphodiesterase [Leptospira yanagawae]EOQ87960.1 diguanylate cyclase (GGDEF) domain protein [Leptospira yanagawae serovar Saopaulo str. Sao Paulo = ATCC 700523]
MASPISVLILEDDSSSVFDLVREMKANGLSPLYRVVESLQNFELTVLEEDWDAIICSTHAPFQLEIPHYLKFLNEKNLDIPVILLSEPEDFHKNLTYMKSGVNDIIDRKTLLRLTEVLERERRELVYRKEKNTTETFLYQSLKEIQLQKFALDQANKVSITDANGIITYVNDAFAKATGYQSFELLGQNHRILKSQNKSKEEWEKIWETIHKGNVWRGEILNTKKDGSIFWVDTTIVPFIGTDGSVFQYIAIHHDITDRKLAEEQLTHDAFYDNLTGLPNRALYLARIEQKIFTYNIKKDGYPIVFCINIDNFKRINHSLGNEAGDQILIIFAEKLKQFSDKDAIITRLGADNFSILMNHLLSIEEAVDYAYRLFEYLGDPIPLAGYEIYLTASCGISAFGLGGKEADVLLRNAEIAMFHAKSQKVGTVAVFNQAMQEKIHFQLEIQNDLKKALNQNEISVFFQPILDLKSNQIGHWEALVRWRHPQRGMVSPAEFIPLAEDSGLIVPITRFVLEQTANVIEEVQIKKGYPISIAVNLSPQVFYDQNIFHWIVDLHKRRNIPYASLQVEITESLAMKNLSETVPILSNLIDIGVKVALDDFGTGFSSLSYLEKLPLSILKIDKSFLNNVHVGSKESFLLVSIINMAHDLGYSVVAEGVEELEQLELLQSYQCDEIQGYWLSKPIPFPDIIPFLDQFYQKETS